MVLTIPQYFIKPNLLPSHRSADSPLKDGAEMVIQSVGGELQCEVQQKKSSPKQEILVR